MDITVTVGRIVRVYRGLTQSQYNQIVTGISEILDDMGNTNVKVKVEING